MDVISKK